MPTEMNANNKGRPSKQTQSWKEASWYENDESF